MPMLDCNALLGISSATFPPKLNQSIAWRFNCRLLTKAHAQHCSFVQIGYVLQLISSCHGSLAGPSRAARKRDQGLRSLTALLALSSSTFPLAATDIACLALPPGQSRTEGYHQAVRELKAKSPQGRASRMLSTAKVPLKMSLPQLNISNQGAQDGA